MTHIHNQSPKPDFSSNRTFPVLGLLVVSVIVIVVGVWFYGVLAAFVAEWLSVIMPILILGLVYLFCAHRKLFTMELLAFVLVIVGLLLYWQLRTGVNVYIVKPGSGEPVEVKISKESLAVPVSNTALDKLGDAIQDNKVQVNHGSE